MILRRVVHVWAPIVVALICGISIACGVIDGDRPSFVATMILFAIVATVILVLSRRVSPGSNGLVPSLWLKGSTIADIEVSLTFAVGCGAIIAMTGGLQSPLYPLFYATIAFVATFLSILGAAVAVFVACLFEVALVTRAGFSSVAVLDAGFHFAFIAGAAVVHIVFLRRLVIACRNEYSGRLAVAIAEQKEAARDYRLISASLSSDSRAPRSRKEEQEMLVSGGVQEIRAALYHHLQLLLQTVEAEACVLLWLDASESKLKLKEVAAGDGFVVERSVIEVGGVLGAIVRDNTPLLLDKVRSDKVAYAGPKRKQFAFCGVPVIEDGHLRGILCVDRLAPFAPKTVEILESAARQVMRTIRSENVFLAVERAKYEHERFYHASAMLCEALTLEQVMETAFQAAAEIADYDVGVISLYDRERKRHRVCSVRIVPGAESVVSREQLVGLEFRDNTGLASMVVKNRHFLPAGGEFRDTNPPVYTKRVRFRGAQSLLVLPLLSADEAIGTVLLLSKKAHRFGKDVREMLRIIANQVAVSLQNALMYRKMETMATTDGLTGLTNHRTFQIRLGNMLARAGRHGHRAAVLLCDVDHFKKVNDTYGHQVGDAVLKQVARILQQVVRKIDITARYGGEEFVVVLESTNEAGALRLAERIRKDVGELTMDSERGTFHVTLSIGVAVFPEDARDQTYLIECADNALYFAKENGRNQVVSYQTFLDARRGKKAS